MQSEVIMSKRIFFVALDRGNQFYEEKYVDFKFYTGFALSQKQKSIESMHEQIRKLDDKYLPFEVSRKSKNPLGQQLSAFNLMYFYEKYGKEYPVENVFQSSKIFEFGGPYLDLLNVSPSDAKKSDKLKSSGKLIRFSCDDEDWDLLPYSMFYDWIYIKSLIRKQDIFKKLVKYNVFTDIEFNSEKSKNCQARAVAIAVSLYKRGLLEKYMSDKDLFRSVYSGRLQSDQIGIFEI